MDRKEAEKMADKYIPGVFGIMRTAWINGYIGYPQKGVARYQRSSAAAIYRQKGINDKKGEVK